MVPGGEREFVQWLVPTVAKGASGTSGTSQSACPGGAVGAADLPGPPTAHILSGNDYWSGHLGIDIAAGEGAAVTRRIVVSSLWRRAATTTAMAMSSRSIMAMDIPPSMPT